MMQLSVIIVNYNVKHFLEQCLLSVEKAVEGLDAEVWVVDNNSVDGSVAMVQEKFPWVRVIANKKNTGFSVANNQAIRKAEGKYVLLLNPDTIVEESTFRKCVEFMDAHPDGGALGVKMIDGNGKFLPESKRGLPTPSVSFYKIFGLWRIFPKIKKFGRYYLSHLDENETNEIEILSGAFMFMRKAVLDEIGLLDESFFMYGEDVDLSYRVTKAGYKNYYFPETKIIHYKGESTKKASFNYVKTFYNAMIIFARKHFTKGRQTLFITLIQIAVYLRALLALVNRFVRAIAFPALESVLIYGAIIGIKEYWEYIHKIVRDGIPYPPEFDYMAAPVYTLVLVALLWVVGAYKRPYKLKPILTAAFSGFIAIATVSYIFPEINFSRMIVGLGSVATAMIALFTRGLINLRKTGNFFFTEETKARAVIVGEEEESERITRMIRGELNYPVEIVGHLSRNGAPDVDSEKILGTVDQLGEIVSFYKIEEIIFSNKSLPAREIMELMSKLKQDSVRYKIVPPGADYLIGPQVIHSSLYSGHGFYKLDQRESRYQKRVFDMMSSIAMLLTFPLHFWLYKNPGLALKNLWNVLRGEYHLVGYIRSHPDGLPEIKEGILNMLHRVRKKEAAGNEYSVGLDRHYAQSYSLELDIEIWLKGFRKLGEVRKLKNA